MTTLTLKIPESMAAELEAEAKERATTKSEVVRSMLDECLHNPDRKKQPSAYDVLDAMGIIGCMKDGPEDLATNPKYMEGFGRE